MNSDDYLNTFEIKLEELCGDPSLEGYPIPKRINISSPTNNNYMDLKWYESKEQDFVNQLGDFVAKDVLMVPSGEPLDVTTMETQVKMETDQDINKGDSFYFDDSVDLFNVDKNDLIQGPTLAELNATDDNLLDDFNFDDYLLPLESWNYLNLSEDVRISRHNPSLSVRHTGEKPLSIPTTLNMPPENTFMANSLPGSAHGLNMANLSSSVPSQFNSRNLICQMRLIVPENETMITDQSVHTVNVAEHKMINTSPIPQEKHSTLHQLLQRTQSPLSPSLPPYPSNTLSPTDANKQPSSPGYIQLQNAALSSPARLSSSAPTANGLDFIWQRREPRKHLLSTGSLAEDNSFAGSASSLSTSEIMSPGSLDWSQEDCNSDDSDRGYDDSSDNESDDGGEGRERSYSTSNSKKERYFWQYNVQSKGPKGQRIVLNPETTDPHVLSQATDPVFNPAVTLQGIRHSGKARRGDGNDLTPSPKKLWTIGKELDKLNEIINDMTPVSELPFSDRTKSRKEKNKLASRACRLKKKAQHEANKLKLYGLEQEHRRLMEALTQSKIIIKKKIGGELNGQDSYPIIERLVKGCSKPKIAGNTSEFVNKVLEKVKEGDPRGGFDELLGSDHRMTRHKKMTI